MKFINSVLLLLVIILFLLFQYMNTLHREKIKELEYRLKSKDIYLHECLDDLVRQRMGGKFPHEK